MAEKPNVFAPTVYVIAAPIVHVLPARFVPTSVSEYALPTARLMFANPPVTPVAVPLNPTVPVAVNVIVIPEP